MIVCLRYTIVWLDNNREKGVRILKWGVEILQAYVYLKRIIVYLFMCLFTELRLIVSSDVLV